MAIETMPTKNFRVPDDLWQAAMEKAAANDERISDVLRAALHEYTKCDECTCDICGLEVIAVDDFAANESETAAVWGFGQFSDTTNPDVQALIGRAKELLTEGAVGVSVSLDINPADLPPDITDDVLWDPEDETLANAGVRIRHVAIVDTPAFSGAHLAIQADGTLAGPVVFEGMPTGDLRSIELNKIVFDESIMPVPIIFDIEEGDHTGVTVGFIDRLERVTGTDAETDVVPLVASAHAWPARAFAQPEPGPMRFEDIDGYTRYYGTLAPTGVCHKGRAGCYTYKGADLGYFHSGAEIPLDDGTFTRVGRIVSGGIHADANLLDYDEALARTDDARRTVAMGRAFDTPQGLVFSGVLLPDVDKATVAGSAPSVELWPNQRGKLELKTALLVNQPAFPVAASVGGGVLLADPVEPPDYDPLIDVLDRVEKLESVTATLFAAHLANTIE